MSRLDLSIVVTTFNRRQVLSELLAHLAGQSDLDFQVVVAIDGSTDGTADMLASLDMPYDLKWVDTRCDGYGLAVARNLGILAADGRAVAILDDDSFPRPDFVREHKRSARPGVITGGPREPADAGNTRMLWKMAELAKLPREVPMAIPELRREWPNAYLIENNICMLRDDFIGMGLFSERLKMYGYIGQEFFGRAEFLGIKYQYNHGAGLLHHGEFAGDNGLSTRRKERETRVADFLRPSLMRPHHYRAQVAWAQARVDGKEVAMPAYRAHAIANAPILAARMLAAAAKRRIRRILRP